jgi:hypothetical protein
LRQAPESLTFGRFSDTLCAPAKAGFQLQI